MSKSKEALEAALREAEARAIEAASAYKAARIARLAAMEAVRRASLKELSPCPFCGEVIDLQVRHIYVGSIHRVLCTCGAEGPNGETTQEARALWNKRAVQAPRAPTAPDPYAVAISALVHLRKIIQADLAACEPCDTCDEERKYLAIVNQGLEGWEV